LLFLVHEGYLNIRRNGLMSIAALGTVAVTLTVLGASLWSVYRINEFAQQQPQTFNEIDLFLKPELTRDNANDVLARVEKLPDVKHVHLIPREQAWKDLTSQDPTLTVAMPDDPLPDALHIETADARNVQRLALTLRDANLFPEIERVTDAGSEVRIMLAFARLVKVIGGSAAAGLFIATLFIVYNTIRLTVFARRREIRIMQLVGATSWFIRLPLLLEGLFHGVAGAGIAGFIVLFFAKQLALFVNQIHSPLIGDVPSQATPLKMMGSLVLVGAFVGLTGSYLSIRRYLRQV
jgi:cell division transport system permease protein